MIAYSSRHENAYFAGHFETETPIHPERRIVVATHPHGHARVRAEQSRAERVEASRADAPPAHPRGHVDRLEQGDLRDVDHGARSEHGVLGLEGDVLLPLIDPRLQHRPEQERVRLPGVNAELFAGGVAKELLNEAPVFVGGASQPGVEQGRRTWPQAREAHGIQHLRAERLPRREAPPGPGDAASDAGRTKQLPPVWTSLSEDRRKDGGAFGIVARQVGGHSPHRHAAQRASRPAAKQCSSRPCVVLDGVESSV